MAGVAAANHLAQEVPGIKAYHGSPHDFDAFSMDKIGTGEGAQAFGHGLYFAESEGVAKHYRDTLSAGPNGSFYSKAAVGGEAFNSDNPMHVAAGAIHDYGRIKAPFKFATDVARTPDDQVAAEALKLLRSKSLLTIPKLEPDAIARGKMYEVNIKADPNDFLDWDKPLSAQSEKVKAAVEPELKRYYGSQFEPQAKLYEDKPINEFLRAANPRNPVGELYADQLREAGVPGIRYLDQGSRSNGNGSRNLVVFDDKLISILRKYGLVGGMVAGAAGMSGTDANAFEERR
jgi:hypothetical protein